MGESDRTIFFVATPKNGLICQFFGMYHVHLLVNRIGSEWICGVVPVLDKESESGLDMSSIVAGAACFLSNGARKVSMGMHTS